MSAEAREPNEIWEEIRRTALLVKLTNVDDVRDALAAAHMGEKKLEPDDLGPLVGGFSDAQILVRLLEEFDRSQGCDGIDSAGTDSPREELWGPPPESFE